MPLPSEGRRISGKKALLWAAVLSVLVFGITSGLVLWTIRVPEGSPDARCAQTWRFDSAVWRDRARAASPEAPRACMADDLLTRYRLMGMPRAEVHALLGPGDLGTSFEGFEPVYWLGPPPGKGAAPPEWLGLRFDPDGRVAEVRRLTQ